MKKNIMLTVLSICVILIFVGCKNGYDSIEKTKKQESDEYADMSQNLIDKISIENAFSGDNNIEISGDFSSIIEEEVYEYNESGKIIIVMYHKFAKEAKDEWTRSYDNFYKDLEYLYEHNYRSISLNDYLNNNIKVPVGTTPIIFTFDDGTSGQFNLIKNESGDLIVNPNSAVGIMEKFYSEHPDFGLNGTFFINGTGFFSGQGSNKERLSYLINKGFEIGNHTNTHVNFSKASIETIEKEVGVVNNMVSDLLDGYEITSLALPFGISSKEYKEYIAKGSYDGKAYDNKIILLVGSNPALSPNNEKLNLLSLPRVRARGGNKAVECDLYYWLEKMEQNPNLKYERIK